MLQIVVPPPLLEEWDELREEFVYHESGKPYVLQLEHSLISLSKWEERHCKPFISSEKNEEENLDYIKCMTLTPHVPDEIYDRLTKENIKEILDYIEAPMTATTFSDRGPKTPSREKVTAELIYYWMIKCQIPIEFQKWHLNKLMTLIRVCEVKDSPPKKHSQRELLSHHAAVNAARRKAHAKG